jgi:hypothetical protein
MHICDLRGSFFLNLLQLLSICILLLQVLIHAARNFALQEHAIENTESVSFLRFIGVDYRYRVFHKERTNLEASFRSTQATPHAITKSVV